MPSVQGAVSVGHVSLDDGHIWVQVYHLLHESGDLATAVSPAGAKLQGELGREAEALLAPNDGGQQAGPRVLDRDWPHVGRAFLQRRQNRRGEVPPRY